MSSDGLKIQGEVSLSTGDAETALGRVGDKAGQMAINMTEAGKRAGKAIDEIGNIANATGEKLKRSEASIVGQMKSIAREAAKGEDVARKLANIEFNIASKGLNKANFDEMFNVVNRVVVETQAASTKAAGAAAKSLDSMGMSAKQTAAALRGVPAQFTDILTSLQGGQAPLTVFLQQGGQLKDMFGGAGAAAKALGGYVSSLINPFSVAIAAAGSYGYALYQAQSQADEFTKTLIMTGNAAGMTSSELMVMAQNVASATGTFSGTSADALNKVASSGKIAKENFELVTLAAVQMQRETGQSIDDTIKQFESLAKDPVKSLLELNSKYNFLTESVYRSVKAAQDEGDAAKAAAEAQKVWASEVVARTDAVEASLGRLDRGWRSVASLAASAWNAMQGGSAVDNIQRAIKEQQQTLANIMDGSEFGDVDKAKAYLDKLIEQRNKLTGATAAQAAEVGKLAAAEDQWAKITGENLNKQQKQRKEIAALDASYAAKAASAKYSDEQVKLANEYGTALAAINDKYTERTGRVKEAKDSESDYYTTLSALQKQVEKELSDSAKAEEAYAKALASAMDPLLRQADALEQQVAYYGMTEQAIQSVIVARLEEARALAEANGAYPEHLAYLDQEIEARKRIAAAAGQKSVLDANKAAAEKAAQDWQRVADDVGRGLTDAIFSGGKSGWDLLKKTIEATVIRVWVQPAITGMVGQAMGIPSASAMPSYGAGAGGSQGSVGAISSGYSLYNTIANGNTAVYAGFNNFATSSLGQTLGLSQAASADFMGPSMAYQGGVGYNLSSTGSALSQALPYLPAVMSLASGNYAGAIGSAIGASVGGPIGAVIGNVLGSAVGGLFGGGGGPKTEGYAYGVIQNGQLKTGTTKDWQGLTGSQTGAVENMMKPVAASISKYIESLGGSAEGMRLRLGFNSDPQGTAPDWVYSGIRNAQGKGIYSNTREVARGGAGKELTVELQRMALASVKAAEGLNPVFKEMLDGFNIAKASVKSLTEKAEELQKLKTVVDSLELINVASTALSKSSIAAAGGIDALSGKINAYYDTYFSAAEKEINTRNALQKQVTEVFSDMGKAVPASAKEFRTLVESLDTTTDAGKAAFASLMSVSGAFASMDAYAAKANAVEQAIAVANLGTVKLTDNMLKAAGGLEALANNVAGYYESFFSTGEKEISARAALQKQVEEVFSGLDLSVPTSTQGFRDLVEGMDKTTDSGKEALASLLKVSGVFSSLQAYNAKTDTITAAFKQLSLGAVVLTDNLLKAAGGMDAMANNLAGFYENYYSPDEKQAATESSLQAIFEKMGLIMPGTTDGFRAMVKAVDTSSPFGEKMLAGLLSIQDQFYQYASAKQSAAETAATEALNASRDQVSAAYEKEAAALGDVISKMGDFERAIGDFRKSLRLDAGLSAYSPGVRLSMAQSEFTDTARRAALGDTSALGSVTEKAQTYLSLARDQLNTDEYARAFAAVDDQLSAAEKVAKAQKRVAEESLDELKRQVSGILSVDSSVRSVSQTIASYMSMQIAATRDGAASVSAAIASMQAAQEAARKAAEEAAARAAAEAAARAAEAAAASAAASAAAGISGTEKPSATTTTPVSTLFPWISSIPKYATGGDHFGGLRLVGERGPEIEATGPARIFNFEQTKALLSGGNNEPLLDELRALRQEVANLKAAQEATARNTAITRRLQERWDGDGMPETRAVA